MKYRILLGVLLCACGVTACSTGDFMSAIGGSQESEEATEEVKTYEELVEEYMQTAYTAYKDRIGETVPGERIVTLTDYGDIREYSVYLFDETGYSHDFYIFSYEHDDYIYNQTKRIEDISIERKSLIADDNYQTVYFRQEYISMGTNAYEFFRTAIMKEYKAEQVKLDLDSVDDVECLTLKDGATSKTLGLLEEYIEPEPEYEIDSAGWVLASSKEELFKYVSVEDGIAVTGYLGKGGNKLVFPSEINGVTVVELRQMNPVEGIEAVEIPSSVIRLKDAFKGWSELKYVFFSEGLERVSSETFNGSGVSAVSLPSTVQIIGSGFYSLSGFTDVKIPSGVKELNGTLRDMSFNEFIIPGTVKVIGDNAFANCVSLTTVFIENGVETIKSTAFEGCMALQAIAVPSSVTVIELGAIPPNTLLVVTEGSYAKQFAENHGITYVVQ